MMAVLVVMAALLVAVLVFWLLWRREAGVALSLPLALAVLVPLLLVAAGLWRFVGYNTDTGHWLEVESRYRAQVADIIRGRSDPQTLKGIPAQDLVRALQRQVVRTPTAEGWFALGILYEELQGYPQALRAAQKAVDMSHEAVPPQLLLCRLLITEGSAESLAEARQRLNRILDRNPGHDGAQMMLGVAAARSGDYDAAIKAWEVMLGRHGNGPSGDSLRQGLAELRQRRDSEKEYGHIQVTVTAPESVPAGGTLFVFIRQVDGQGQPLAAKRTIAGQFPATVEISAADWLQAFPAPNTPLVAGARYADQPGAAMDAGVRSATVPLEALDGVLKAQVSLPESP